MRQAPRKVCAVKWKRRCVRKGERVLNTLDVVQREDFEALREMAIKARSENSALLARIEALEARLAKFEGGSSAKPAKSASVSSKSKDNS